MLNGFAMVSPECGEFYASAWPRNMRVVLIRRSRPPERFPLSWAPLAYPLGSGVVTNLARPGANVTGCSSRAAGLEAKRLQLLKEAVPGLSRVAILFNPTNHYMPLALQSARKGAQMLDVALAVYEVHDSKTLDAAFVTLTKDRPDAL